LVVPGLLVLAAAVAGAAAGGLPDLHVYRYGGDAVLHQAPLYDADDPVTGYPFTYPPFAALVMVPLSVLPGWLAAALWTGASTAALLGCVAVALRAEGRPAPPGAVVGALALGALALEPVWQTLSFGQVNLLLMLVLLVDLLGTHRRWSGVAVGVVAGIKITPLVFVALLVLTRQRGAAGRALAAFAGTVVVGLLALPGSAPAYWTDGLLDARRVGPPALAHNQSVHGALTRLLGEPVPVWLWCAVAGPLAVAVLLVAVRWWGRDRLLAICLGALAMLVASPVSWSHHWVWAVPVALALRPRSRWAALAWTAVFVARPIVWPPWANGREYAWRWFEHLPGNAYLLAALVLAGALGALSGAGGLTRRSRTP